jgi:hypothetical protein
MKRMFANASVCLFSVMLIMPGIVLAAAPDSKRLGHAKDYIADEQWARAIVELQAAANDPKEPNRDEALFWLAHSEHQTGDDSSAIRSITRLERTFPASRWVRPARSLRVEIAQRMGRDDLLWMMVAPPPPPAAPSPRTPGTPRTREIAPPVPPPAPASTPAPSELPTPMPARPGAFPSTPPPSRPGRVTPAAAPPALPAPGSVAPPHMRTPTPSVAPAIEYWLPSSPDTDLRIEALGGLLEAHGERVIPLLREIALDGDSPDEARRAVFVMARSTRPEARSAVIEVARRGSEPVRLAAIRELGRFNGATISNELMHVYSTAGTTRVKRQVVSSLGERADNTSLLRIARSETDPSVRNVAIVTLGRIPGAREQLRTLYTQTPADSRIAVLTALFTAKDEDELIRIAQNEKSPLLRQRARQTLRMLATPKALKFLHDNP